MYAGKIGTGFDHATLHSLHQRLFGIEQDTSPFVRGQIHHEAGTRWARPQLVAEIGFSEWTRDGKLRRPRYIGLRTDKDPDEVIREMPCNRWPIMRSPLLVPTGW
ncbi:hypothetical protein M5I08_12350 [Candidatus Mycobacterium methanotrophicum]|uniref:DNA ligase (ATP) n=1 Tax=Candidatus Mycobacterium methanotrophicum TaxID=2943498 RepID=A0ABY4QSV0_9MYCO|nr:hypothetical protein [Candidatus Mycobacterium methanotrophicum]UQX13071.1 hypothetical protein M5I08_12350 [Candidatus Mycobacterium methanotrophicum]